MLPDVPQVARNLQDLAAVVTDEQLGGFPAAHCVTAPPDATVQVVGDLLHAAAATAEDLLLFYFAGHGVLGGPRSELHLALRGTRFEYPAYNALRFETVRETFIGAKARNRVVIIDSCFSARAIGTTLGARVNVETGELEISGTCILASAPPNSPALALDWEEHTAFTGRMLALLRGGSADSRDLITFRDIYQHLQGRLRADGLPEPRWLGTENTDELALVRNRHNFSIDQVLPAEIRSLLESASRRGRLAGVEELRDWLADANYSRVAAAHSALRQVIAHSDTEIVLAVQEVLAVARSLALRARASAALGEAERITYTFRQGDDRTSHLGSIATTLAAVNPKRSLQIATGIARDRSGVLTAIAKVLAPTDPSRALGAVQRELATAGALTDTSEKSRVLCTVAIDLISAFPHQAEEIAISIPSLSWKANALLQIASLTLASDAEMAQRTMNLALDAAMACTGDEKAATLAAIGHVLLATNPSRGRLILEIALETAHTIIGEENPKAYIFTIIAEALAATDPDRAREIMVLALDAVDALDDEWKASALYGGIASATAVDVDRAIEIAMSLTKDDDRSFALVGIAGELAKTDPDRAEAIAASITYEFSRVEAFIRICEVLRPTDYARAERVTDRAVNAAFAATEPWARSQSLAWIAAHLAEIDPDRAEQIAYAITDEQDRARSLNAISVALLQVDPERAEQIANNAAAGYWKAHALTMLATHFAAIDPDRAERIALAMFEKAQRVSALTAIARVWLGFTEQ